MSVWKRTVHDVLKHTVTLLLNSKPSVQPTHPHPCSALSVVSNPDQNLSGNGKLFDLCQIDPYAKVNSPTPTRPILDSTPQLSNEPGPLQIYMVCCPVEFGERRAVKVSSESYAVHNFADSLTLVVLGF